MASNQKNRVKNANFFKEEDVKSTGIDQIKFKDDISKKKKPIQT